jgi:hypothetical protein
MPFADRSAASSRVWIPTTGLTSPYPGEARNVLVATEKLNTVGGRKTRGQAKAFAVSYLYKRLPFAIPEMIDARALYPCPTSLAFVLPIVLPLSFLPIRFVNTVMLADKSAEENTDSELSSIMTGRSLLDLPVELLEEVKGHLHSLQSHVYFAQTCTKINSLYDEETWRRILFAAGYAIPLAYMEESEVMWDDWAFAVVQDAELFRDHQEITGWVTAERGSVFHNSKGAN